MKKLVFIEEKNFPETEGLREILKTKYELMEIKDPAEVISTLDELTDEIISVMVFRPSTISGIEELFTFMKQQNTFIFAIPALIISTADTREADEKYLEDPVIDAFDISVSEKVLINKVERASQFLSSVSFNEFADMLTALPSLIYLKDARGKYVFCTQYWHHLEHYDDPDWTIRGKTDMEIRKDTENARRAYESDLQMIKDGKGRSYIIEENEDGIHEYLQIIKEPLKDDNGNIKGIIALINNVTEQENMKRELEQLSYTDELTGVFNRAYFDKYINEIQDESFPLGIVSADCDNLKIVNDNYGHMVGDEYIRMSVTFMKSILPENSVICRTGGDEFVIFIPGCTEGTLWKYVNVLNGMDNVFRIMDRKLEISFGSASAKGPQSNLKELISLSDAEMYRCKKHKKSLK